MKLNKLTNRDIVELLYHNHLVLDPRMTEIILNDGTLLILKNGELYKAEIPPLIKDIEDETQI